MAKMKQSTTARGIPVIPFFKHICWVELYYLMPFPHTVAEMEVKIDGNVSMLCARRWVDVGSSRPPLGLNYSLRVVSFLTDVSCLWDNLMKKQRLITSLPCIWRAEFKTSDTLWHTAVCFSTRKGHPAIKQSVGLKKQVSSSVCCLWAARLSAAAHSDGNAEHWAFDLLFFPISQKARRLVDWIRS